MFHILCFLFTLLLTGCTTYREVDVLPVLKYAPADTLGGNVGIRPYRTIGLRLEKETLGNKTIFHNYGHGGAGVSLAPGSVLQSVRMFEEAFPQPHQKIAIIGSGYMGILTASMLSEKGHKVTVYAQQFPQKGFIFKGKPCITSQAGAGFWMPFGYYDKDNKSLQHQLQVDSWRYYKRVIQEQKFPGIRVRPAYCFGTYLPYTDPLERSVMDDINLHDAYVRFEGYKNIIPVKKFHTISIVSDIFLSAVFQHLKKSKKVIFIHKTLHTTKDLQRLKESVIFNCTGNGSKNLFHDPYMKPIRGQIMYLKPQNHDFFLFNASDTHPRVCVSIYPLITKTGVGGTYEEGNSECVLEKQTFDNYRKLLDHFYKTYLGESN